MQKKAYSTGTLEIYWWLLTFVIITLILFPIYYFFPAYPFFFRNAVFITIFITLFRLIFFLKYTFFAKKQKIKVAFFFLSAPLIFYLFNEYFSFQIFIHNGELIDLLKDFDYTKGKYLAKYIGGEYLFFLFGSIFCAFAFAFRMLQSIWLLKNRGRV